MSLVWLSSATPDGGSVAAEVPTTSELAMVATASAARAMRKQQTGFMAGLLRGRGIQNRISPPQARLALHGKLARPVILRGGGPNLVRGASPAASNSPS
jgi:hypothetical protein